MASGLVEETSVSVTSRMGDELLGNVGGTSGWLSATFNGDVGSTDSGEDTVIFTVGMTEVSCVWWVSSLTVSPDGEEIFCTACLKASTWGGLEGAERGGVRLSARLL